MFHLREIKNRFKFRARHYNAVVAFLNNFCGGWGVNVQRPDKPSPQTPVVVSLDQEALDEQYSKLAPNDKSTSAKEAENAAYAPEDAKTHLRTGQTESASDKVDRVGTSQYAARADHKHRLPRPDEIVLGQTTGGANITLQDEIDTVHALAAAVGETHGATTGGNNTTNYHLKLEKIKAQTLLPGAGVLAPLLVKNDGALVLMSDDDASFLGDSLSAAANQTQMTPAATRFATDLDFIPASTGYANYFRGGYEASPLSGNDGDSHTFDGTGDDVVVRVCTHVGYDAMNYVYNFRFRDITISNDGRIISISGEVANAI